MFDTIKEHQTINLMSKNTQIGLRLPNDILSKLENEKLKAFEQGDKVTTTELIVKYLYLGLESVETCQKKQELKPTLERLADVLERFQEIVLKSES